MGDKVLYQPLTKEDRITVILYRAGILLSALVIWLATFFFMKDSFGNSAFHNYYPGSPPPVMGILLLVFYFSVGLSVFFIHLYIGKFHRLLKRIYYLGIFCLVVLFAAGKGNPSVPLETSQIYALLLIPISVCFGFVTAKEAFCFKLMEGYLLAMVMPAYLFFYGLGVLSGKSASVGLAFISAMVALFVARKVFMPLHFDVGDKAAYQP